MLTECGLLHLKVGQIQQAVEKLRSALALDPTHKKALLAIGYITQVCIICKNIIKCSHIHLEIRYFTLFKEIIWTSAMGVASEGWAAKITLRKRKFLVLDSTMDHGLPPLL